MIRLSPRTIALTGLTVVLTACAAQQGPAPVTVVDPVDNAVNEFATDRTASARAFEANGDLAAALVEWRLVAAVQPRNSDADQQIKRLEALIRQRAQSQLEKGELALSSGRRSEARTAFLKVLALEGTNAQATRRLREIERQTVLANQQKKDDKALAEYRASHAKPQQAATTAPAGNFDEQAQAAFSKRAYRQVIDLADQELKRNPQQNSAANYRRRSYEALAKQSRDSGNLREALTFLEAASETPAGAQASLDKSIATVRSDLAESLYSQGLDLMNSDLDQAIDLLAEALVLEPGHAQAKQRLDQAERMRTRLRSIQ
ncbi:MAG: tetratricopeptide repeat protein [Alphaproteobacteria bacterium]